MSDWFNKTSGEVLDKLKGSREAGLAEAEVLVRRKKSGPMNFRKREREEPGRSDGNGNGQGVRPGSFPSSNRRTGSYAFAAAPQPNGKGIGGRGPDPRGGVIFAMGLSREEPLKLMFLAAVFLTVGLQFMIIYLPLWQGFFHTRALSGEEILLCLGLSSLIFWAVEIEKAIVRRRREG